MVNPNQNIHYRCPESYCKGSILRFIKGTTWRCNNCGREYKMKSTLENFGLMTANQLHKVRTNKKIEFEDLTDTQFKRVLKEWKKKNLQ